jgi:hypothetical protein
MRTHVEFRSAKFPAYEGEEEQVNPGLWGKRLAEYVSQRLRAAGFQTGAIYTEDWGWGIPLSNDAFPMWIGCGRNAECADGYLIFVEPSKPLIRRFLRKIDTTSDVGRVADALDEILTSDSEIHGVRWWGEDET